jgi:hypothetical protein
MWGPEPKKGRRGLGSNVHATMLVPGAVPSMHEFPGLHQNLYGET